MVRGTHQLTRLFFMHSTATQTLKSRNLFGYFVLLQLHLYFTFIMKKLSELVFRCRVKDLLLLEGPTGVGFGGPI